jgi:hypothetical protein
VLQALFPALFGLIALAIACEAVRSGRVTLRGMHFARRTRPTALLLVIAIYVVMGLPSLAGALWICLLSARGPEPHPAMQPTRPSRVASPLP